MAWMGGKLPTPVALIRVATMDRLFHFYSMSEDFVICVVCGIVSYA